jgi:anti-anti-sigma regulatory factor
MEGFEELNIQKVRAFHSYLKELLSSSDDIVIDLQNVSNIDASCIQLLIACKKSCIEKNKTLTIENLSDDLYENFALIGADIFLEV